VPTSAVALCIATDYSPEKQKPNILKNSIGL
jgi:hypothetical protein